VLTMPEVVNPIYDEVNAIFGTDHQPISESMMLKAVYTFNQIKRKVSELLEE